ncbi:hydrolase [Photobacterium leiognathi subsp. mandapamensis]|nr:hydrolase [Photobacterium leiognathi subsp. mandapamensis]
MVASGNTYKEKVSQLISWGHWFSFFNIIAAMLLGTRYITHSDWPATLIGQLYLLLSWVGHFGFLVFGIYILIIFPASFLIPSQRLMRLFGVLVATVGLTALLLDTYAYQSVDLHLSPLVWDLLLSGDKTELNARWQYLFVVVPVIFLLELMCSEWVWRKLRKLTRKHVGGPIAFVFGVCFLGSHLIYIWADANLYRPVTMQRSNFPFSYPMTAKTFMEKHGLLDRQEYTKRRAEQGVKNSELVRYPIQKLSFNDQGTGQNLMIIMVDSLRSDMITPMVMPNLSAFADQNLDFTDNYSSSNSDSTGVFGLLYGLPSGYANSIRAENKSPILLNTLQNRGYHFGLFSGENFELPIYREAIFANTKLATTDSEHPDQVPSDAHALKDWQHWLVKQKIGQPWFSFLELTSVQQFKEGEHYKPRFTPSLGSNAINEKGVDSTLLLKNSYRNAAFHIDEMLGRVFADLEAKGVLDNTIVVIASNHGTEFNETGNNTWGSGSNYSKYQIKVPLIIHWPDHAAQDVTRLTSNLDVVPTLMESLLNVATAPSNYSSGVSLFDQNNDRRWILAGNDDDIVVVQKKQTTVVDKYGNYNVYDNNYQLKDEGKPKLSTLMQVMNELKRFYEPKPYEKNN